MHYVVSASLIAVGLIHLLPALGAVGAPQLARLYGVAVAGPDLLILLRHRAVLFGVLGVFFIVAAFARPLQLAALLIGLASVASFIAIARAVGGANAELQRVVKVDAGALIVLAGGLAAHAYGG